MPTPRNKRAKTRPLRKPTPVPGGPGGEIVLYYAPDGTVALDVRLERDALWLSQKQMAGLLATERSVITKHLRNIFQSGELQKDSVCALFAHTAEDGKTYRTAFYNLDAAISVGYRVNSKRGTHFRIWATRVLREHILTGYTVNEQRLTELQQAVRLVSTIATRRHLEGDEASALLRLVSEYSFALDLLDDYDHKRVKLPALPRTESTGISPEEARRAVDSLRARYGASNLFGRERDDSLSSALAAVFQTVGGRDAYPSLEEKAAHLLYFLVKNHPFVDGNKRIAAALFLWFLERNHALYIQGGTRRVSEETLVAVTLMMAESRPAEKEVLTALVVRLLHHAGTQPRKDSPCSPQPI